MFLNDLFFSPFYCCPPILFIYYFFILLFPQVSCPRCSSRHHSPQFFIKTSFILQFFCTYYKYYKLPPPYIVLYPLNSIRAFRNSFIVFKYFRICYFYIRYASPISCILFLFFLPFLTCPRCSSRHLKNITESFPNTPLPSKTSTFPSTSPNMPPHFIRKFYIFL